QERRKNENSRDPLAAETGAPEAAPKTESEAAAAEFELPSVIGSPVFPGPNEEPKERVIAPKPGAGNGAEVSVAGDPANHHAAPNGVPIKGPIGASVNGSRANNSAAGNALNEIASLNPPPIPAQAEDGQSASRVVEDIRSRQTDTQRLREEL